MAIVYLDSFRTYDTAALPLHWGNGNGVVSSTSGRFGRPGLTVNNNATLVHMLPPCGAAVVGAAFLFNIPGDGNDRIPLFGFRDSTTLQAYVEWNNRILRICGAGGAVLATGTTQIAGATGYYLEFKVTFADSIAANSCVLRVNGVVECTAPAGGDTKATANATANQFFVASTGFGTVGTTISDLYILDGTGTINNDFLGDRKVEACVVTGDGGLSDWTANAGTDWQAVDDPTSDGDATYVASATVGQYDTFTLADLPAGVPAVDGVQVRVVARKDDAGSRAFAPALEIAGVRYDGAAVALGDTYAPTVRAWDQNPATSAAWTETAVNALGAGVKLVN
jgi:hypothetical protein